MQSLDSFFAEVDPYAEEMTTLPQPFLYLDPQLSLYLATTFSEATHLCN